MVMLSVGAGRTKGMTLVAYRFALDPTPAQERALRCMRGGAGCVQLGPGQVLANLDQREAEKSYGSPGTT